MKNLNQVFKPYKAQFGLESLKLIRAKYGKLEL